MVNYIRKQIYRPRRITRLHNRENVTGAFMDYFKKLPKRWALIALAAILLILLIPIPVHYDDGGTVEYKAILYSYTNYHSWMTQADENGNIISDEYMVGYELKILGIKVARDTHMEPRTPVDPDTPTPTDEPTLPIITPTDEPTAVPTPTAEPTKAATVTPAPTKKATPTPAKKATPTPTPAPKIDEDGWYYSKDDVALYIHTYGKLPSNYITKEEAEKLGWTGGSVQKYKKGAAIGGSYFGNYEGLLPKKNGRKYYECDIDTNGQSSRGAKRIIYSNDGLIYYTDDHYKTFTLLYGKE